MVHSEKPGETVLWKVCLSLYGIGGFSYENKKEDVDATLAKEKTDGNVCCGHRYDQRFRSGHDRGHVFFLKKI